MLNVKPGVTQGNKVSLKGQYYRHERFVCSPGLSAFRKIFKTCTCPVRDISVAA